MLHTILGGKLLCFITHVSPYKFSVQKPKHINAAIKYAYFIGKLIIKVYK